MTGVCESGGVNIHYLRTGGSKPPVILLHGLTGSGACWSPLARLLEDAFDVVMPDARGHGKSGTPLHGYGYDNHAGDVPTLMRELGLASPVLLGHSMGGMTAALVASRAGAAIGGVILVDPTFLSPQFQREVYDSDAAEQHRRLLSLSRHEVLADMRARHPHRSAEMIELMVDARLQTRMSAFEVLKPPNPDYRRLVGTIRAPTLLVIGDIKAGAVVSPETAQELQGLNPRLRVEQVQGAGHGLPHDQPEHLGALVRSFLASAGQPQAGHGMAGDAPQRRQ